MVESSLVKGNEKALNNASKNAEVLKSFSLYLEEGM